MDFIKSQKYIAAHREETIKNLCRFITADTLLFWSNEPDLNAFQKKYWQPILDDLNTVFKLQIKTTTSLYAKENEELSKLFEQYLQQLSDKELTVCFLVSSELKSVLLGWLLSKQKISSDTAFEAAFLEEIYQNRLWGEDVAALNAREKTKQQLRAIEAYLNND